MMAQVNKRFEDKFFIAFAHQMRSPLQTIQSSAEFALEFLSPQAKLKENLEIMRHNAQRLSKMVNALLDMAKRGACRLEPGRLSSVVEAALSPVEPLAEKQGVAVEKQLQDKAVIKLDANILEGALYNLFLNAIEAMPSGGRLAVEIQAGDQGARLTIEDTGQGMAENLLAKLGEPFVTTKENGTGLGLYVTKQILDQHGAQICWKSQKGKGTKATIIFPRLS
ncbi:MAG: HAMP domain-containing histidine kinase [Elusimicrobia bacterium]|nr:HAMP domain-containing histidine kinase [Elusimicrobiota bacterium]